MPALANTPIVSDADLAGRRHANYLVCHDEAAAEDPNQNFSFEPSYGASVAVSSAARIAVLNLPLAQLITFDPKFLEKLVVYADALMYVEGEINSCSKEKSQLAEHAAEAYKLRSLLLAYADVLCITNVMDPAVIAKIRDGSGYQDLSDDMESLCQLYTKTPGAISGQVTKAHVDRAGALAALMGPELTDLDNANLSKLLAERRQIASLLSKAHHQVHRAIFFLRDKEGDTETIIPSLYQYGSGRPASKGKDPLPVLNPSQPAAVVSPNPTASSTAAKPPTVVVKSANPMDNPFDDEPFDKK